MKPDERIGDGYSSCTAGADTLNIGYVIGRTKKMLQNISWITIPFKLLGIADWEWDR